MAEALCLEVEIKITIVQKVRLILFRPLKYLKNSVFQMLKMNVLWNEEVAISWTVFALRCLGHFETHLLFYRRKIMNTAYKTITKLHCGNLNLCIVCRENIIFYMNRVLMDCYQYCCCYHYFYQSSPLPLSSQCYSCC